MREGIGRAGRAGATAAYGPFAETTPREAAAIFADFARTDTVAEFCARRELDLSAVQSGPR